MGTPQHQKRSNFRLTANVQAYFLPVTAAMKRPVALQIPLESWARGVIHDISAGGVRLIGPLSLDEHATIAIYFTLPSAFLKEFDVEEELVEKTAFGTKIRKVVKHEADFKPMEIYGKLINYSYLPEVRKFQYHVKFVELPKRTEEELLRYVTLSQRHHLKHRRHAR